MANVRQLSQCLIGHLSLLSQYVPMAILDSSGTRVVLQHLCGSHNLVVLNIFLAFVVMFQITKPGSVEKIFVGIIGYENIFIKNTKNLLHENSVYYGLHLTARRHSMYICCM